MMIGFLQFLRKLNNDFTDWIHGDIPKWLDHVYKSVLLQLFVFVFTVVTVVVAGFLNLLPNIIRWLYVILLVPVVGYWIVLLNNTIREKLSLYNSEEQRSSPQASYKYVAERYGIGYRYLKIECAIDETGSATVQREVHIEAYSKIEELDTYLLMSRNDKEDNERGIGFQYVRSLQVNRDITYELKKDNHDSQKSSTIKSLAVLKIVPFLEKGEHLKYELEEKTLPFFAIGLNKEQLTKRKEKSDNFAWNINRPTRYLILHVSFPLGHAPNVYWSEVRYAASTGAASDNKQELEQQRISKIELKTIGQRHLLQLEVEYPMHGLVYFIYWRPLVWNN